MKKYYVSGLLGSAIPGFIILVLVLWSLGILLWAYALPVWIVGGYLAGLIGSKLEKGTAKFATYLATALLGFIIATLLGILVAFFFM